MIVKEKKKKNKQQKAFRILTKELFLNRKQVRKDVLPKGTTIVKEKNKTK